jgi:Zn-dependent peptidase ImmA (M78 family)
LFNERNAQRSPQTNFMARTCTICTHHRRDTMDRALLRGEQLKTVARRYGVSDDALGRHRKHMQLVIAKAASQAEQKDLAYGSALLAEIARIRADADRLQIESERRLDVRGFTRQ